MSTFPLHTLLRNSQYSHGLREDFTSTSGVQMINYEKYRRYCSNKIRSLRKKNKFTHRYRVIKYVNRKTGKIAKKKSKFVGRNLDYENIIGRSLRKRRKQEEEEVKGKEEGGENENIDIKDMGLEEEEGRGGGEEKKIEKVEKKAGKKENCRGIIQEYHLALALYNSERSWSFGQQLKFASLTSSSSSSSYSSSMKSKYQGHRHRDTDKSGGVHFNANVRSQMLRKYRSAIHYATILEDLCKMVLYGQEHDGDLGGLTITSKSKEKVSNEKDEDKNKEETGKEEKEEKDGKEKEDEGEENNDDDSFDIDGMLEDALEDMDISSLDMDIEKEVDIDSDGKKTEDLSEDLEEIEEELLSAEEDEEDEEDDDDDDDDDESKNNNYNDNSNNDKDKHEHNNNNDKKKKKKSKSKRPALWITRKTVTEATGYKLWLMGNYKMEREQWREALDSFLSAFTLYENLALNLSNKNDDNDDNDTSINKNHNNTSTSTDINTSNTFTFEQQDLFVERAENIQQAIRLCFYNLSNDMKRFRDERDEIPSQVVQAVKSIMSKNLQEEDHSTNILNKKKRKEEKERVKEGEGKGEGRVYIEWGIHRAIDIEDPSIYKAYQQLQQVYLSSPSSTIVEIKTKKEKEEDEEKKEKQKQKDSKLYYDFSPYIFATVHCQNAVSKLLSKIEKEVLGNRGKKTKLHLEGMLLYLQYSQSMHLIEILDRSILQNHLLRFLSSCSSASTSTSSSALIPLRPIHVPISNINNKTNNKNEEYYCKVGLLYDIIKVYDTILTCIEQILDLPGMEEYDDILSKIEALHHAYRSFKSYYLAELSLLSCSSSSSSSSIYSSSSSPQQRYNDAASLFLHAKDLVERAEVEIEEAIEGEEEEQQQSEETKFEINENRLCSRMVEQLEGLKEKIEGGRLRMLALEFLNKQKEQQEEEEDDDEEVEKKRKKRKKRNKGKKEKKGNKGKKQSIEESDLFCRLHSTPSSSSPSIYSSSLHFAPKSSPSFQSVPPKPQFFDIVYSSILCSPNIEHRVGKFTSSSSSPSFYPRTITSNMFNEKEKETEKKGGGLLGWFR